MSWQQEVAAGKRFQFGANWRHFLSVLNEQRIEHACQNLCRMLGRQDLRGLTFLDVGSGSGLSSLAARRLGARVRSFDFDQQSVACTSTLRQRYFPDDAQWAIETGSVLDRAFLHSLGTFDVVYSWGVLHHTGAMHQALHNVAELVKPEGQLWVALYNYLPKTSRFHTWIKRTYVGSPAIGKAAIVGCHVAANLAKDLVQLRNPMRRYGTQEERGMSGWYDLIDWVGGYPFETAAPGAICEFFIDRGFELQRLKTEHSGCNDYVFRRQREADAHTHGKRAAA